MEEQMPAPVGKPVIVDDPGDAVLPSQIPKEDEFLFYDGDFARESEPKYALADPTQVLRHPHFSPPQVASWVFGRNAEWMRIQLTRLKPPVLNGQPLKFRRLAGGRGTRENGREGERRMTLPDVERYAWSLYAKGTIDGKELQNAINIVIAVARQYGVEPRERKPQ